VGNGFWQSRERYRTQDELLETLREFRERGIPIDNIVQDWSYWPVDAWGDHEFDSERFPDPQEMGRLGTRNERTNHDLGLAQVFISRLTTTRR